MWDLRQGPRGGACRTGDGVSGGGFAIRSLCEPEAPRPTEGPVCPAGMPKAGHFAASDGARLIRMKSTTPDPQALRHRNHGAQDAWFPPPQVPPDTDRDPPVAVCPWSGDTIPYIRWPRNSSRLQRTN